MAVNEEIRSHLPKDAVVLDNASFDNSIIGVTFDGRVIYALDLMIHEYKEDNHCSEEEAMEWIDYNTIRALPYAGPKAPIIVSSCESR